MPPYAPNLLVHFRLTMPAALTDRVTHLLLDRASVAQLGINIVGMVIAGTVVLLVMRWCWPWVTGASERVFGRQADLN